MPKTSKCMNNKINRHLGNSYTRPSSEKRTNMIFPYDNEETDNEVIFGDL